MKEFPLASLSVNRAQKRIENGLLLCSLPSQITIAASSVATTSFCELTNVFSRTVPRTNEKVRVGPSSPTISLYNHNNNDDDELKKEKEGSE